MSLDLRGKKILVTGGRGFLGRHLVSRLSAAGVREEDVYAPSRAERDLLRLEDCVAACEVRHWKIPRARCVPAAAGRRFAQQAGAGLESRRMPAMSG